MRDLGPTFARGRAALLRREPTSGDLAFLREAARTTYRAAERMSDLAGGAPARDYPGHDLGRRLRLVARLITGGFGTRIFQVALGGFDTHSAQRGTHAGLLSQLATALFAFQRDLEHHGAHERVATLVFSEFGRRVQENGSRGTDHGAGAPVFLVGGSVRGGLHGAPPDLARLEQGDVPYSTDFRSIYACLERDWMGLAPSTQHASLALVRT